MRRFTSQNVPLLREQLNRAVSSYGEQNGMIIHFGDAKFDPLTCTFQVKVSFVPGEDFDPARALWELHCGRVGLAPDDLGKELSFYGSPERYKLVGYNPKARVNSIIIRRLSDDKLMAAAPEHIYAAIYGKNI